MHQGAGPGTELASGVGCRPVKRGMESLNPDFPIICYAGEDFTLNRKGQSVISYADYADAFVNEVLNQTHNKERISFLQA